MLRMLAFALLPLVSYCAFLTVLHFRKTPTVLNGEFDFILLAWGLFGLFSLGPGRLIIPLYVFAAWGVYSWLFWTGFYFVIVQILARQFKDRMIVYHGQRELLVPAFFSLARQIDPKTDWSGNVLSLHGLGVQWSVTHDRFGGHILFVPTNSHWKNPHCEMLQEQLTQLCRTLEMPNRAIRWFWGILTFDLLCLVIGLLLWDFPAVILRYSDYWLSS